MRRSESPPRLPRRGRCLSGSLGLLLFGTGCPQLLDDDFAAHESELTTPDPNVGGSDAEGTGGSGGNGQGGSTGLGGGYGESGAAGGSGAAGAAGSGGSETMGTLAALRNCPFGEPEPLVGLDFGTGSEWGPSLSSDGLTLYFAHETAGDSDLYRATRPARGVTFSTPVALAALNSAEEEGTPFISADRLRLYFHSMRAGGLGGKDLYVATRASASAEFTSAQLLANVNSSAFDHLPRLSPDELSLWFTSTRDGGAGGADLWTASRASLGAPFGTPVPFNAINGSAGDESGALTQDGLVLVFDSTREGAGNNEIFTSTRSSVEQAFQGPIPLSTVNSTANEYNVFLTPDEREIFFSSNRDAGVRHHLFRALRRCD